MTDFQTADALKAAVREEYGSFASAQLASGGCCTPDCCTDSAQTKLYAGQQLDSIPAQAVQASRGCGNPLGRALIQPGQAVLDLGSGGGLDAMLAAERTGPSGRVYGVDMTDSMLELGRANVARAGFENIEFIKGDIEDLPLPDQHVDLIISNCVINLAPDKARTLREAWRVLRPGGWLAVSDIVIDGSLDDLPVDEPLLREAMSWSGCIAGALTSADYRSLLEAAGFTDVTLTIDQRYHVADIGDPAQLAEQTGVDPAALEEVAQRFTSSFIQARRPLV